MTTQLAAGLPGGPSLWWPGLAAWPWRPRPGGL